MYQLFDFQTLSRFLKVSEVFPKHLGRDCQGVTKAIKKKKNMSPDEYVRALDVVQIDALGRVLSDRVNIDRWYWVGN